MRKRMHPYEGELVDKAEEREGGEPSYRHVDRITSKRRMSEQARSNSKVFKHPPACAPIAMSITAQHFCVIAIAVDEQIIMHKNHKRTGA
jgi:hypothetical protein